MMKAMYSAVNGTRNHQIRMDVIGNNISNVNTIGFKASRVSFQEALNQILRSASKPTGNMGGVNPMQVGIGCKVRSIDVDMTQGGLEPTGRLTDMAIQGSGFFVVSDGSGKYYFTRVGAFDIDKDGALTNPGTGWRVQGKLFMGGVFQNTLSDIKIPIGDSMDPAQTTEVYFKGNLSAEAEPGVESWTTTTIVYDSKGREHEIMLKFSKVDEKNWNWTAEDESGTVGSGTIAFDDFGKFESQTGSVTLNFGTPQSIELKFDALTQYGKVSSVGDWYQDGYASGSLETFTVDQNGVVTGIYSNGQNKVLAKIVIASFANPGGLIKEGGNLWSQSANSGDPDIGEANDGGRGAIISGVVEMSNVDLAREFTDMIITQRGFQANTRVITSADEMLQELINLKR